MPVQKPAGLVPVGCVIAYLKSLTNSPALPSEYVECNGQTLSDAQSVFNGVVIPNLNASGGGTKRFLRGSTTSGSTGGSETHTHTLPNNSLNLLGSGTIAYQCLSYTTITSNATSTLPSYYEVVYVMRIK